MYLAAIITLLVLNAMCLEFALLCATGTVCPAADWLLVAVALNTLTVAILYLLCLYRARKEKP
jgi:hypothetical protein